MTGHQRGVLRRESGREEAAVLPREQRPERRLLLGRGEQGREMETLDEESAEHGGWVVQSKKEAQLWPVLLSG